MSQQEFGHASDENREARIEHLRRQIAAGTYRVSPGTLARVLMDEMRQKPMRRAA